jgi:hypothetical protein
MSESSLELEHFAVLAPDEWEDVTDQVREELRDDTPYTLARTDGVGALQFSLALFAGGRRPEPTFELLTEMLLEAAAKYGAAPQGLHRIHHDNLLIAWTDFHTEGSFVRMWYLSDHLNFAKVTYVCTEQDRGRELEEAHRIVSTFCFRGSGAA